MTREDRVDELRDDGVFVADDAGEERSFCLCGVAEFGDQVFAKLVFDAAGNAGGGEFTGAKGA